MGRVHGSTAILHSDSSKSLYSSMHEAVMEGGESIATLEYRQSAFPAIPLLSQSQPPPPLRQPPHRGSPVRIRIQRLPLLLATLVLVALVAVLMWLCVDAGVRLETFVSTDKDDSARKRLLDKYNSLSGNFVSVVTKPLELFSTLTIALVLLCFATNFTLSRHTTRYHQVLLVAAAAVGYLLTNGFNAINVQLAPRPIQAVISAQDLSQSAASDAVSLSNFIGASSSQLATRTSDRTLLEEAPRNPITNTAFRNWVLSAELNPGSQCRVRARDFVTRSRWDGVLPFYGFPQRSWQSAALGEFAEPAKSLRFAAENPSAATARVLSSHGVDADKMELPMSVNRAMHLLVNAVYASEQIVLSEGKYYKSDMEVVAEDVIERHTLVSEDVIKRRARGQDRSSEVELPTLAELLLMDKSSKAPGRTISDQDVVQVVANLTLRTFGTSSARSKVDVEFTHFNLSDGITFDAITLEFPSRSGFLQRRLVTNASTLDGFSAVDESSASLSDGEDRYYDLDALTDCSLSACALNDTTEKVTITPRVVGMRVCVDKNMQESLRVVFGSLVTSAASVTAACEATSNSSVYTVSIGKRIEGEEILHDTIGEGARTRQIVRLKNARKVYSVTVGQLTWETRDLAALYGAACAGDDKSMCEGIRYELNSSANGKQQYVVVGSKRIPMDALVAFSYTNPSDSRREMLSLLKLFVAADSSQSFMTKEDLVLPRRFNKASLPRSSDVNSTECSADVEDFAFHTEMNHLYIEKSVQPAYTAAVFFLFQDGVVRDVIDSGSGTANSSGGGGTDALSAVTLAFVNNKQLVDVRLSSPLLNIVFTLAGAGILLAIAVAVTVLSKGSEFELERLADAHNIAEMLIDNTKYPSLLLEKTIVSGGEHHEGRGPHQERKEPHRETSRKPLDGNVRIRHVELADVRGVGVDRDGTNQLTVNALAQARESHRVSVL